MKRLMLGGLVALGLMLAARPARADFLLQWNVCRNICIQHTAKQRCFTFTSHSNPICCPGGGYGGYGGLWGAYYAYGAYGSPYYGGLASAAPAAAAPAATTPATTTPSFTPPQPTPTGGSATPTGLQQAGYFYYPPAAAAGYGYGYGYDYGVGYSQAPNYWY
jgi:hypothetical protein